MLWQSHYPNPPTDKSVCFSNDTFVKLTIFLQETDEMVSRLTGQINHLQRSYDDLAMCIRIKAVEGKPAVECLGAVTI